MHQGASAAGIPNRNRAALALIFFMHILALLGWMRQRPLPLPLPQARQVVSFLLRPAAPKPALKPAPKPAEAPAAADPAPRHAPRTMPGFSGRLPAPVPVPVPSTAEPSAPAAPAAAPGLEDARAPASVGDAIREQKEAEGGFGLNLSKRQAGRIDRELRHGRSGVPDEPDTPMGRFRRGLEAAHIDRSKSVHVDTYTSPDGTIIYRKRIGKGTICRRGGSISPLGMNSMAMGGEVADNIPCPSGVEWKKD